MTERINFPSIFIVEEGPHQRLLRGRVDVFPDEADDPANPLRFVHGPFPLLHDGGVTSRLQQNLHWNNRSVGNRRFPQRSFIT